MLSSFYPLLPKMKCLQNFIRYYSRPNQYRSTVAVCHFLLFLACQNMHLLPALIQQGGQAHVPSTEVPSKKQPPWLQLPSYRILSHF